MIEIPDNRLTGETKLRQLQLILLRLLKTLHYMCEESGLKYWLDSGTLLGAVRHKGFIPWDDDIDVVMPLDDYNRLCEIAKAKLPFDMFLQTQDTDIDFLCPWIKIRDRFSYLVEKTGPYPYSQAASIDIFPAIFATRRHQQLRLLDTMLEPYYRQPERVLPRLKLASKLKSTAIGSVQKSFRYFMRHDFLKEPFKRYVRQGERLWQYEAPIRWKNLWPDSMIFPLKKITFEDGLFWAPANAHQYLTDYYGDYCILPPEESRISEHGVDEIFPIGPNPHFSALNWKDYYAWNF